MILTSEWPDVYGNLMVDWGEEYDTYEPAAKQLLKFRSSTKKTGKASDAAFFGLAPDKQEGNPFPEEDPQQNYAITWEQTAIGNGVTLTEENFLYEETMDMSDKVRELARSGQLRVEHDITMRLRYGNALSFNNISGNPVNLTLGDTKALIAADHPIPNQAASVVNNNSLGTLPFNRENLVKALNRFRQFRNPKGLKITGLRPTHIVTSDDEEMRDMVERTLKSSQIPGSANNDNNPLSTRGLQHLRLPYLQSDGTGAFDTTGRFYWFVICQPQTDYYMVEAQAPEPRFPKELGKGDPNLPITGDHKVTMRGTYGLYIRRPVWIVGSFATQVG